MKKRGIFLVAFLFLISLIFIGNVNAIPQVQFVDPTPINSSLLTVPSVEINATITEYNLGEMKFNSNGANYTSHNSSLVLMMNFDNVTNLGESYNNSNGSVIVDVSNYHNNGTLYTGANAGNWTTGKYGGAYNFDGIDDYMFIPYNSSFNSTKVTLAAWINPKQNTGNGVIVVMQYGYGMRANSNQILIFYYNGSTSNTLSGGSISTNNWNYLTMTFNGSRLSLYMDGSFVSSNDWGTPLQIKSSNISIGNYYWLNTNFFNGTIDEVRIWNRSLSESEIQQSYLSNLRKYDIDKWNFYIKQQNLTFGNVSTYFLTASNLTGNENSTEVRNVNYVGKTTPYYDNRKATVIFSADDWGGCGDYYNGFINASNAARKYKVVFSPGILPLGYFGYWYTCRAECPEACSLTPDIDPPTALRKSQWNGIQTQIDGGFVSPSSHSMSHRGDAFNYTNGTSYEFEINGSKMAIINNLTLPWQNQFNGSQYLVGFIEPFGYSDAQVRDMLNKSNYLISRRDSYNSISWCNWNNSEGLYDRCGLTIQGDTASLTDLNNNFSNAYSNGGIYHFYVHPRLNNWTDSDKIPQHLSYIGNRTDIWYVDWGQLYSYHYLENQTKPTINITAYNDTTVNIKINASGEERNRYGLSYPITYAFYLPSNWSDAFVLYKNTSDGNYAPIIIKTRNVYWNGIDAYRRNLTENTIYVSKGLPQTSNELYLKIIKIPLSTFSGTNLSQVNLSNITNLVLERSYGKINFSENINLFSAGAGDLDAYINISQNYISVDSATIPELNKSATLTLYNLAFTNPRVLKDGAVCPDSICTMLSYSGGNFTFTVTRFSTYSIEETPLTSTLISIVPGSTTFTPTDAQFQQGYEVSLQKNQMIQFSFKNENHTITLNNITNNTAIITVSSNPIIFNLTINETKKINLNNDSYYDLSVFLKNITNTNANLVIKTVHEKINNTGNLGGTEQKKPLSLVNGVVMFYVIVGFIGALIIIFAYLTFRKIRKGRRRKNRK